MQTLVKVAKVGNSRGIRLSKRLLQRYGIGDALILEETADAIVLRVPRKGQLNWEDTYREMAQADEDWTDWDALAGEGQGDED
jgi:antitoxin MazE